MTQSAPVLRQGSGPSKLLLKLWSLQGQGERLISLASNSDSTRLAELRFIRRTPDGFVTLTQEGRLAAHSLEASS